MRWVVASSEVGGSFQVFVSSLAGYNIIMVLTNTWEPILPVWLLYVQSWPCFNVIHMVILISIYIFLPATRVSVVAEAICETTNQIGMA